MREVLLGYLFFQLKRKVLLEYLLLVDERGSAGVSLLVKERGSAGLSPSS